jgi:hypothetical protein
MDFNCRCVHKIANRPPHTLSESNAISLLSDRRVESAAEFAANLPRMRVRVATGSLRRASIRV